MKNSNIKYIIINILLLIAIALSVWTKFCMLLWSPYEDWDYTLKIIDDDKLLILRL